MVLILNEYVNPRSIDEAYSLFLENRKNYIKGGGAWLKLTLKSAEKLISLDKLNLDKIIVSNDLIEIGSMTTLREIETNENIVNLYNGILSKACHNIMGINVRNIATIGGTVMSRLAFSDIYPALLVMDTTLVFYKLGEVSLSDFLRKPMKERDILLSIKIKKKEGSGFYKKVATTALDFSIINFAIVKTNNKYMISIGSTPYIASLAYDTMEFLNKQLEITSKEIEKAISILLEEIKVSDNTRSSKDYRVELIKTYFKRGIKKVNANAS